jgi:CRISP-associated protein Cas1
MLASVRAIDVSQVCVVGNVQVSTQALRALFAQEVPICFFTYGGWFSGIAEGLPGKHVELRRRQVIEAGRGGLAVARRFVAGKIANQRTLLRRNARHDVTRTLVQLRELQRAAEDCRTIASLLGIEGTAARLYFDRFPSMLRDETALPDGPFSFEGRNKRPPTDPINALLSFLYSLLIKDLTVNALAVAFDPYLGFLHRPRFGRPALALDLAEEFRALVADSSVLTLVNNGEVSRSDFVVRAGGVQLTADGRRAVISAYERRLDVELTHPLFGYRVTYRRLLEVQARLLAAHLMGEIDAYVPITTR